MDSRLNVIMGTVFSLSDYAVAVPMVVSVADRPHCDIVSFSSNNNNRLIRIRV